MNSFWDSVRPKDVAGVIQRNISRLRFRCLSLQCICQSLLLFMATAPVDAGYYRYPLEGFHKACADGSTTDVAIFSGYGMMYLSNSGNPMNAFPLETMSGAWTPILGGSSLCWSRPMSQSTRHSLVKSWQTYCVNQPRSYCVYE